MTVYDGFPYESSENIPLTVYPPLLRAPLLRIPCPPTMLGFPFEILFEVPAAVATDLYPAS